MVSAVRSRYRVSARAVALGCEKTDKLLVIF